MKYGSSKFEFKKRALIKTAAPIDLTDYTSCTGFEIGGTQPENTERRIIFEIDGALYKFVNNILDKFPFRAEFEDVIKYGNTVGELLELTNLHWFCGKKIYPIIALAAPTDAPVMPKIKLALKVSSYNDIYTTYKYSPVFETAACGYIYQIKESKTAENHATATSYARLLKKTGWSDWEYLPNCENQEAQALQFRTQFIVSTLDGTDFAKNSIEFKYLEDVAGISSGKLEIISSEEDFDSDLKNCRAVLKHKAADDLRVKAYVNLRREKILRENIHIGTGDGTAQKFYLQSGGALDRNVEIDTLRVEVGGVPVFDYDFDGEKSFVEIAAPLGSQVMASYECGEAENWQEMTLQSSDLTKKLFSFQTDMTGLRRAAVRFEIVGDVEVEGYIFGARV